MNVNDTACKLPHDIATQDAHKSGQHYQSGCIAFDSDQQCPVECIPVGKVMVIDYFAVDAMNTCCLEAAGICPVADHCCYLYGKTGIIAGLDQRSEIAAPSGYEYNRTQALPPGHSKTLVTHGFFGS